ncbi:zinc metalloproteinase nas-4-like [Condylostylus longicornis]|uniref:zinc metalloproteinase nas-4-like n=1 Tax=Condylostylus longicornis TaxID=2530218 RepID=UPI00244DCD97|nr:zinc metalloproteinase nas-4-like [Condylostylus longicornis]
MDNAIDLIHFDRSIYTKPDYEITASKLINYNNESVNPEELGTYLEGDILIPFPHKNSRNGLISQIYRWPNNTIPYLIEGTFTLDELDKLRIGFNEYHIKTCIRFIPRTIETDYITIVNGKSGCWSSIGKIGGRQEINLQTPACLSKGSGTFIHELMHVGNQSTISAFGLPYDYGSIMHYSPFAFSSNGQPTIIAKFPTNSMGQRIGFSSHDISKINAMYKCDQQISQNHNNLGHAQ